jgi:YD repeat-containing protein
MRLKFVRNYASVCLVLLCIAFHGRSHAQAAPASASSASMNASATSIPSIKRMAVRTNAATAGASTHWYAAPYTGNAPTLSIAIAQWYKAWQQAWPAYAYCTYQLQLLDPNASSGRVATATMNSPCGGTQPFYATEYSHNPGRTDGNPCNCAGDPIELATGNEFRADEDVTSGTLRFARYYNSSMVGAAHIGALWRHSFDRSIEYLSDGTTSVANVYRPDGHKFTFTLQSGQWVTDSDLPDHLTEQTDSSGNLAGWVYFDTPTRNQETYNASGQLVSIVDPNGQATSLTYSTSATPTSVAPAAELLLSVVDPTGRSLSFMYNAQSQISSLTLPDGGVITYAYDSNGNLTSVTYPDKSIKQYLYNEVSLRMADLPNALTSDIDEANTRFTSIAYNSNGQAFSSNIASDQEKTQISYNADGTTSVTYPTGSQSTLSFTAINGALRISTVNQSCGMQCGQPNASATFDSNGYPASTTDFNGNVTKTTYDANGLLSQQVDAAGTSTQRTTNFSWNTALRIPLTRSVLDANGNAVSSTQWVYNSIGQMLARCEIDPSNSAASGYACSNMGTVPAGVRRWTYTYCTVVDTTHCPIVGLMLTSIGPRTDITQTTSYSYYMSSSATNCGTPGAACYQAGDLHTVTDPVGHMTTIVSYDADGRITRTTDANGVNTDLTYTPRGWLASRNIGGAATNFTYTPYGAVQTVTDPDGTTTTYGYDAAHRLVKITDAQGNYVQYTLDAAGNKTAEQVYDSTGTLRKSLSRTFNTLGQLTKVMDGLSHTVFDASASGSYDANGNLIQSADGLGIQRQMGYDALNRLVQTLDNYNGTN